MATKRIITCVLLLLAAMPLIYILVTSAHQQVIRHRMKERLEAQVLHTVTIPEQEVHWLKNEKEILVNSRMFDIKTFHIEKGVYVFSGLYDEEETAWLEQLQKDQQNTTSNSRQLVQIFQLLQSIYYCQQEEIVFPANNPGNTFFPGTSPLISPFISIFSPPPQA